jgi:hypothetical protein
MALLLHSSLSLAAVVISFTMPCRAHGHSAMATAQIPPLRSASAMVAGVLLHGYRPFPLEAIPAQAKSNESLPILRSFVCAAFPRPPSSPLMSLAEQSPPSHELAWPGQHRPPRAGMSSPTRSRRLPGAPPPLPRRRHGPQRPEPRAPATPLCKSRPGTSRSKFN